jgi:hypothetical protein
VRRHSDPPPPARSYHCGGVEAEKGNGLIWLRIVEQAAMQQHIVADAASFANDLKATGHVAVYGIFFDTGKAALKPESKPALECREMLKADGALAPGRRTHGLGQSRTTCGRAGAGRGRRRGAVSLRDRRVAPRGPWSGPPAPVAGNDDEADGRRTGVELVKQS